MPILRTTCCGMAIALATHCGLLSAAELQAGIAVVDITPPVPFRMSGYFVERVSTGLKDPLHAKAVVFQQGSQSAALVFCDLIGMPVEVSSAARRQASATTGIPVENIAVAATHTHTGPLFFGSLRNHFHQRSIQRLGSDPYEKIDYPAKLTAKIVAAIAEAKAALQPVELKAGCADETRLAFNRRFHMKNGTVRFNPGKLNPDIIRPAGPIDPQVCVISLSRPGTAHPFATIASFAMHLDTVGGTEYSADYPKQAEDRLRKQFGPEFTLLFGTGTCGDINHIDVTTHDVRTAAEIGSLLAETIAAAMNDAQATTADDAGLAIRSATIDIPLQAYSNDQVAAAQQNMDLVGTRQLTFLQQVAACKITNLQLRGSDAARLEVQVFRLNDETAIVTLPGEVFVELGLAIKRASPFRTTLVIELTNDSPAYVPTRRAFAEGSYETVNSQVQSGGGEKLIEAAIGLIKELK